MMKGDEAGGLSIRAPLGAPVPIEKRFEMPGTGPDGAVAILGVPTDDASSYLRGAALAPPVVRGALHCPSSNRFTESGGDLDAFTASGLLVDAGDLDCDAGDMGRRMIAVHAARVRAANYRLVAIGGDHAVTVPLVGALADVADRLTIVHLDAHPDLYDQLDGNRWSHACPFARIMESGGASRLVQAGVRAHTAHQRAQARRWAVASIPAGADLKSALPVLSGPVYLSVDLDVLDPAFAPGVSHHEPGGLSTREVLSVIHRLNGLLVGADVVEYNPRRDVNGVTARVAAKLVKEIVGAMLING